MASVHPQVNFTYQTEAGTLKFEMGRDGRRVLLGKGSFGKVPHLWLPAAAVTTSNRMLWANSGSALPCLEIISRSMIADKA